MRRRIFYDGLFASFRIIFDEGTAFEYGFGKNTIVISSDYLTAQQPMKTPGEAHRIVTVNKADHPTVKRFEHDGISSTKAAVFIHFQLLANKMRY